MNTSLNSTSTVPSAHFTPLYVFYLFFSISGVFFTLLTIVGLTRVHKPALTLTRLLAVSDLFVAFTGIALASNRLLLYSSNGEHQFRIYHLVPILSMNVAAQTSFVYHICIAFDRLQAIRTPFEYRGKNHR